MDFIRGPAILLVIDYHTPHPFLLYPFLALGYFHFGWARVDIFFVLSGFLLGGLLVKESKLFGRIDAPHFLIRRGFEIWPQYYVFLAVILLTGHRTLSQLWGNFLNWSSPSKPPVSSPTSDPAPRYPRDVGSSA